MKRKMHAKEVFYPKSCELTKQMIEDFNMKLDSSLGDNRLPNFTPRAVLVPDASFLYSGFTANFAYRMLAEKLEGKKRIIVIGASQKAKFDGISGSFYKHYKTPCGKLKIDIDYLDVLRNQCGVGFEKKAHKESSTEVQMPFIKHYMAELEVVELVYSDVSQKSLDILVDVCLSDSENVVVICSNLGELEDQKELGIVDATYLNAISFLDSDRLHDGCNASGLKALKSLINVSANQGLKPQVLNYQTSSMHFGEKVIVNGHLSVAFY